MHVPQAKGNGRAVAVSLGDGEERSLSMVRHVGKARPPHALNPKPSGLLTPLVFCSEVRAAGHGQRQGDGSFIRGG